MTENEHEDLPALIGAETWVVKKAQKKKFYNVCAASQS